MSETIYICDVCGLASTDLPDGVDAGLVFDRGALLTSCIVHSDAEVYAAWRRIEEQS